MTRTADTPCAGGCGKNLYRGRGSLTNPTCRDCRKRNRQKTCKTCGKQYDPGRRKSSKYCSPACSRFRNTTFGKCRLCDASFAILARDRLTFCSRACADEWRTLERLTRPEVIRGSCAVHFPVCQCGTTFASRTRRKYCSTECAKLAADQMAMRRRTPKTKVLRKVACFECGASFEAGSSTAKYCSNRCRKRGRGYSHQSRARKFGVKRESFGLTEIYIRDNWTCGICGDQVDPEAKWPDQMCASLDHVVPLSLGGGHTRDNVQCAHWLCNSLRGADDIDFMVA